MTPRIARRLLALGLLGVAGYYALWGGEYSAWDLLRLREEIAASATELGRTRREAEVLQGRAERLESDPATIERVARERFGMIRDGETLVRFVRVNSPANEAPRMAQTP